MDNFVRETLSAWKLDQLISRFKDEEIDEEAFRLLDRPTIASLIPKIGIRLKFEKYHKELLGDQDHEQAYNNHVITPPLRDKAAESEVPPKSDSGHEMTFNIRRVLMGTHKGQSILSSLDRDSYISIKQRRLMQRILVSHLIERFGEYPTSDTKRKLAMAVVEQLPCLRDNRGNGYEAWYSLGIQQRPSTGFLEECLRNRRKRAHKPRRRDTCPVQEIQPVMGAVLKSEPTSGDSATDMTEWLKINVFPLDQVADYMKETAFHRAKWMRDGPKSVAEVMTEYPRLLDTPGMIAQDFFIMHPEASSKLTINWVPVYSEKMLRLADKEKSARDFLWDFHGDTASTDMKGDMALRVLPFLLPSPLYKVTNKTIRPSVHDALEAFIDWQPVGTNMAEYLEQVKTTRPEPFVLILGDKYVYSQAFTVIGGQALQHWTLLGAVDGSAVKAGCPVKVARLDYKAVR